MKMLMLRRPKVMVSSLNGKPFLSFFGGGTNLMQMYGHVEGFRLKYSSVWVGVI